MRGRTQEIPPVSIILQLRGLFVDTSHNEEDGTITSISEWGTMLVEVVGDRNPRSLRRGKAPKLKKKPTNKPKSDLDTNQQFELDEQELDFVWAVVRSPNRPCSTYTDDVSYGTNKAVKIRKQLIAKGYIREEKCRTTKTRGASPKHLIPTKKACELFPELLAEKKKGES